MPEDRVEGIPAAAMTCPLPFCSHQIAWQRKVTQAVCQALCGKKGFPVLGSGQEPSMPPERPCVAYTFHHEGRLHQATYEGQWCQAKPHGK